MSELKTWFRSQNVTHVMINVDVKNKQAVEFWKELEFNPYEKKMISNLEN